VSTSTEDGITLDGAVIWPHGARQPTALVWVHGFLDHFYSRHILRVSRALAERGIAVITGNTRGHDIGALAGWTATGPFYAGGWWELLDQSPRDVGAWMDVVMSLGFGAAVLFGHSLGTGKVLYYQAQRQDARVRGLILASPGGGASHPDLERVALAEQMVAEGRGYDLLPWERWQGALTTTSAQTHLSHVRFGALFESSRPDAPIAQIRCPLLAFLGTEEGGPGRVSELEALRHQAVAAPRVETHMVPHAGHIYAGHEQAVATLIAGWMESL
jgi:dienelactone hydrolase